jgi:hypothetical protein
MTLDCTNGIKVKEGGKGEKGKAGEKVKIDRVDCGHSLLLAYGSLARIIHEGL